MHFLIVKLSSIGDVVHTLPAVAALRNSFPDSQITWVVERGAAAILEGNSTINNRITIDTRRWRRKLFQRNIWTEINVALKQLRQEPVDIAFDLQGLLKSGAIALLARAQKRIGFSNDGLREEISRFFLTHQVVINRRAHVIEKNLQLVKSIGVQHNGPYEFPISVSDKDNEYVEQLLATQNLTNFAIINPGGGWPTKLWSAARFGEVSDWLWQQYQLASLVTFGPGEEALAQAVVAATNTGHTFSVTTTLKQFVALTRRAALFVGGDTGPLHLAAACRTPIVGIYGPTEPARNGPFDPLDISVGLEVECRPNCYRRRCSTIECMDIPATMVQAAIQRRLLQTKLWQLRGFNNISNVGVSR